MLVLVLGFILAVVAFVRWNNGIYDFFDVLAGILCGALGAMLAAILVVLLTVTIMPSDECIYEQSDETPIVALKDNRGITGSHFLFGGVVDDEMKYYYAVETAHGIHVNKVKAAEAYIRVDDTNPRIQTFSCTGFIHWYSWLYSIPLRGNYYIFYVPEGTVEMVYEVDLE